MRVRHREPAQKRFREIGQHLDRALQEFAKGRKSLRHALGIVGNKLGVSIDTVDSWRRGVRRIPEQKIEPLVRVLSLQAPSERLTPEGQDLARVLKATRKKDAELVLSWTERVERGHLGLSVRQAQYQGAGKFWGRVFYPFLDAACIDHSADDRAQNFYELQGEVWSGSLDVALGILSTPRLSLKLWFFNSPIQYRLNCVALAEVAGIGGTARVRRLTALPRPDIRERLFVPIVMKGEVGEAYACRNLGLKEPIWVASLSAEEFCEKLIANEERADGRVPLIIVDEITCLSILIKLKGRGRLVFPLVPNPEDRRAVIPPSFPLGLCVSRNERVRHAKKRELMSFIRDAFATYIEGNARSIAFSYLALRDQVKRMVDRAMPDCPSAEREEWVTRSFRLQRESLGLVPTHWRAVLQEAIAIGGREPRKW
jgi:hypothetical protein